MPTAVIMALIMLDLFNSNTSKKAQLEKFCRDYFKVNLQIQDIILHEAPTSQSSRTTIFKVDRNTIYALCVSDDPIILADIKNIIRSMGMKADKFLPPNADENYFLRFGQKSFQSVFPGHKPVDASETSYYQTLTPYSPALVRINRVDGEIRQYNKNWQKWQKALEFSYARMQVS